MKKLYQFCQYFFLLMIASTMSGQSFINAQIKVDQTQTDCNSSDAALSAEITGGNPPYSIRWEKDGVEFSNSSSVSNIGSGVYELFVTDQFQNYGRDSLDMSAGLAYVESTRATCPTANGSFTATALQNVATPVNYIWSNGSTSAIITGLAAGTTLTVQATDANGCPLTFYSFATGLRSAIGTYTVENNASFSINTNNWTNATCSESNGSATAIISGGTGPFTQVWNTTPVQTGLTASNIPGGQYMITVTDGNGCSDYQYAYVGINNGSINAEITSYSDEECAQQNGSATVSVNGGTAPYSIVWSNNETTETISNLSAKYYHVIVEDAVGCKSGDAIWINRLSPIQLAVSSTKPDCNNTNGSIDITASGGSTPYLYFWNTGASTEDISNLSNNYYWVKVIDANGCDAFEYKYLEANAACGGTISGKVFQDNNDNCTYDIGEPAIRDKYVVLYNNVMGSYNRTDLNGDFTLGYPYSGTFNITNQTYSPYYASQCPGQTQEITVTSPNSATINFAMKPSVLGTEVETFLYSTVARPGFTHHYTLIVRNFGTIPFTGTYVEVQLGADETLMSSGITPLLYDDVNKIVRFPLSYINISETITIEFSCQIPPTVPLQTVYNLVATAYPVSGDLNEANNTYTMQQLVRGSYDPNDIQSFKTGDLVLNEDTTLTYHIRFQNTGTFYAEFVIVRDTLEADLDVNTLRNITTSHPVRTRILEGNVVEFAFENIFLADSNTNEPASHGFINYNIDLKDGLTYGAEIKNSAAIYFDYNAPVLTNKASNIIATPTGILDATSSTQKAWAYPNPAKDQVRFTFDSSVQSIELINAAGQVVSKETVNASEIQIATPSARGLYYYKAVDNTGNVYSGKLMVE